MSGRREGPARFLRAAWRGTIAASGASPGAIVALGWVAFGAALVVVYRPGGPFDLLLAPIVALPPAALGFSAVRRALRDERRVAGPRWMPRTTPAAGVALLLASFLISLQGGTPLSPSWSDLDVRRSLPGPGEVWTYIVAAGLTVAATAPWRREDVARALSIVILAAATGGVVLGWGAAGMRAAPDAGPVRCAGELGVRAPGPIRSMAEAELDGASLGTVAADGDGRGRLTIRYDTRWGAGTFEATGDDPAALRPLLGTALSHDERLTADDLGIDLVNGAPARHCQLVIDGRSAVAGFVALRWLTGADEPSAEAGAALEAWRGSLDYWIVPSQGSGTTGRDETSADLVLASAAIDGQPPDWPFPGLHATLRATVWLGRP